MHRHECNTHNVLFDLEKSNKDFSYTIFPVKKINVGIFFKFMRKLLFNYFLYSHPEIGNFRVWHQVIYGPPKLVKSKGIDGFPPITHQTLGQRKPQNWAPFLTDLGGNQRVKSSEGLMHTSPNKSPRKWLSVRKLVPTLTSKKHWDLSLDGRC
jgi:hypothetical protein